MAKTSKLATAFNIESLVSQYDVLRVQQKQVKQQMDKIATAIKEYAQNNGVKDDSGSFYCENDSFTFGSMAAKSVSFRDSAVDYFRSKGLYDCIKVTESIDKDVVDKYLDKGDITQGEILSLADIKTTYRVVVTKKEDTPEVQTTRIAASTKKPALRKVVK